MKSVEYSETFNLWLLVANVLLLISIIHVMLMHTVDCSLTILCIWNNSFLNELRCLVCHTSSTNLSGFNNHLLALSASQFYSRPKTHLFHQSFPPLFVRTFTSSVLWFIRPALRLILTSLSLSLYYSFISFHLLYGLLLFISSVRDLTSIKSILLGRFYRHSKSPYSFSWLFLISSFHLYTF